MRAGTLPRNLLDKLQIVPVVDWKTLRQVKLSADIAHHMLPGFARKLNANRP